MNRRKTCALPPLDGPFGDLRFHTTGTAPLQQRAIISPETIDYTPSYLLAYESQRFITNIAAIRCKFSMNPDVREDPLKSSAESALLSPKLIAWQEVKYG